MASSPPLSRDARFVGMLDRRPSRALPLPVKPKPKPGAMLLGVKALYGNKFTPWPVRTGKAKVLPEAHPTRK